MSDMGVNQLLQQMRAMTAQAQGSMPVAAQDSAMNFGHQLKEALESVNDTQMKSGEAKKAYELGDPSVSLADVMVASQKAKITFEATM